MRNTLSPMKSDVQSQEDTFLATGSISPVFIKNNHGISYAIFYKNQWKDNKCEKLFQKTVGRVLDDNSIELGKRFLSQYPSLKGCRAKLAGRQVRLSGGNVSALPPLANMAEQRQAFFRELDQDTRLSAGASYVLWEIAKQNHVAADLEAVFGKDTASLLLSLSIFFATDPGAVASEFEIYSHHTWLPGPPATSQQISDLFQQLSNPEIMAFLKRRLFRSQQDSEGGVYWSFDTTSISSYSETIRKVSYGYSKENPELPQINLGLIVSESSGEPLYYKVLEGSLSDPLALRQMLVDTANLKSSDVSLVMDRIFSSPTLLDRLYEQNLGFICGSKTNLSYCKSVLTNFEPLLRVGGLDTFLDEYSVQAKTASTTWTYRDPTTGHQERRSLFIHVYLDPFRAACERESLLRRLKAVEKKLLEKSALNDADRDLRNRFFNKGSLGWSYSPERWRENEKKFGLFILVSNTVKKPAEALRIYRQRDIIEKNFNNLKERCSGRRMHCQESALEGTVFVLFLSLILLMNLKMRFHLAREAAGRLKTPPKYLPDDIPDFLRMMETIDVTSRSSEENNSFYWDLIPKKLRDTLESLKIPEPPRFIIT